MHYKSCHRCFKIVKIDETCECVAAARKEYKNEYSRMYSEENAEIVKPLKTQEWKRLRTNIIHRDGGYCQRCLNLLDMLTTKKLEVHHIIPRSERPDLMFDPSNLITVCSTCNMALGTDGKLDFEPSTIIEDRDYIII